MHKKKSNPVSKTLFKTSNIISFYLPVYMGGTRMNDFLKNLRGSHKKESSDPKKNLDGHYYPQNERRKIPYRRSDTTDSLESLFACLTDILPKFSENATVLTQHLEKISCANNLLIEAKIRQHNAVSDFFDNLNKMFSQDLITAGEKGMKATAGYAHGTRYTKDEILSLIRSMREKEATFAAIADHLKERGIPTFSGRGEWHAQTVHRLCK